MPVSVLWLFLTVPWIGLQCVIVENPDHTHLHHIIYHVDTNSVDGVGGS